MPSNLEEKCKGMTEQADRIEALLTRLIELLEADTVKRTKKVKPFLSTEERQSIYLDYGKRFQDDLTAIDSAIASALDHDAAKKAGNSGSWVLYVQRWLNTEVDKQLVKKYGVNDSNHLGDSDAERAKWLRNSERVRELGLSRDRT